MEVDEIRVLTNQHEKLILCKNNISSSDCTKAWDKIFSRFFVIYGKFE